MLRTDLIETINSKRAWAFLGSGTSVGAGLPTWSSLLSRVLDSLDEATAKNVRALPGFSNAERAKDYPKCFGHVESVIGREELEKTIRAHVGEPTRSSALLRELVDLPFAGYITTNYDLLIEQYLVDAGQHGWVSVGNERSELRKLSGETNKVVWHLHGAISEPSRSRLIATSQDYDDLYLEDSDVLRQLRVLLAARRLVVVGFGMSDVEVMRVMRRVGKVANPTQPIFAFMPDIPGFEHSHQRVELLETYNIDVVPYRNPEGDHRRLIDLVRTYGSFVMKRSLAFGKPERACPSYDPETTGLLVYNELALRDSNKSSTEVLDSLLRVSLLVGLGAGPQSAEALLESVRSRLDLQSGGGVEEGDVAQALSALQAEGLVEPSAKGSFRLSDEGRRILEGKTASTELSGDQFRSSLASRVAAHGLPDESEHRVVRVLEAFLTNCIERRALGVAMAGHAAGSAERDYHIVALLQCLPEYLEQLQEEEEATALTRTVIDVLGRPNDVESRYMGLLLQARFAIHLLGHDQDAVRARLDDFSRTLFLLDSSVLIHLLARSSSPHSAARTLCTQLMKMSNALITTERLCEEVAEHVRWAARQVEGGSGRVNVRTLEAATGRAGQWPNGFLEGYLNELTDGAGHATLQEYLASIFGPPAGPMGYRATEIANELESEEISTLYFGSWDGFREELYYERDTLSEEIAKVRRRRGNYKHERQVQAEAEALLLVQEARAGQSPAGDSPANALFLSHTRLLDHVGKAGPPVTMHPAYALQWLATLCPMEETDLSHLTTALLWELDQRGLTVVDTSQLGLLFGPLISASRSQLPDELRKHHELIGAQFGQPTAEAFSEVRDLDIPIVLQSYQAQRAAALERRVSSEEKLRAESRQAQLTDKERTELEVLRAQKAQRRQKAERKRRAAKSTPGSKSKKRKRKKRK